MVEKERFLRTTLGAMDLVYNIARRSAPTREDAEDLVQETYLAAYRAWQDRRRPRKVEPWLATICLNLARSAHRRRGRRPREFPLDELAWVDSGLDVEAEALARLEQGRVQEALARLGEPHRMAIALVDLAGFTTAEAAKILRVPKGTVLSRLHRGRKALALLLSREAGDREA